ncbi:MAG: hypothetical protein HZB39_06265 [Planctomycetes bacterium]|nr:hypothetical protein [Planctomycetota bacterium]
MQNRPRIHSESSVREGGTIHVRVNSGAKEIHVIVPGLGPVTVPVTSGRAEYTLPPSVPAGTLILISDLLVPDPSTIDVEVVGGT